MDEIALGVDPNIPTKESNNTALHYAACNGYMAIVELLLEHGADMLCNIDGLSPYDVAVSRGHVEIAKMLSWKYKTGYLYEKHLMQSSVGNFRLNI